MLLSIVIKTSNFSCARSSRMPFSIPAQPINATDPTSCPGKSRSSRQSKFSSSKILNSRRLENFLVRLFQQGNDLLAFYAGKPFQKVIDRFARFQVSKKALDRHSRPNKHRFAAKNCRIGMIALSH